MDDTYKRIEQIYSKARGECAIGCPAHYKFMFLDSREDSEMWNLRMALSSGVGNEAWRLRSDG